MKNFPIPSYNYLKNEDNNNQPIQESGPVNGE